MQKTLGYIGWLSLIIIALLFISVIPTEAEAAIYDDTVRLHILANSDSEEDQALKLEIRDLLLEKYGSLISDSDGTDEARDRIEALLPEMRRDVEEWVRAAGYSYECDVTLSEEWYDTREYDGFSLPSGRYTSLRVLIGDAEGKNWWCVMFPPLCLDIATESAPSDDALLGYTGEEVRLISGGYTVKFKLLELLSDHLPFFS